MIRRRITVFTLPLASFLLASCGGGGGSGPGTTPPMTAPPSDLKYPTPPAFVVSNAITPLTPTVVGEVTSYSVSPALPAGLTLKTTTGVISGTPTSVVAKANYTVKATNAGGSTTAIVSIVVNSTAASIAYGSSYYGFTANVTAQTITPTVSGGAVVSWAISPALPAGLVLNASDGTISGTPTAAAAPGIYTVTATNSAGQSKVTITLAIAAAPLLNLGHASQVIFMRYANSSVMSLDQSGTWLLQDYGSGTILASGGAYCPQPAGCPAYPPIDLAGNTAIDAATAGIEIRSAISGQVLATIPGVFSWFQLASDGSYITTGSPTALTAWNTSGQAIATQAGDYSKASVFSAPGQIQVALGPAGQNVIQTIAVPSGSSTVSPAFQGTFNTWFVNGAGFLTVLENTTWVYSSAAAQQNAMVLTGGRLGGEGPFFWNITGSSIDIYQVGGSSSPIFSAGIGEVEYTIPSGTTIGLVSGVELTQNTNQLQVIDLSGATPTLSTTYSAPIGDLSAYAAISARSWVVGNEQGVVFDGASLSGQPRYLTPGQATSIAAGTDYFSVATASGQIFYFNASTDATLGTIDFASSQLSMSTDGTVLAAAPMFPDFHTPSANSVNVYSLPSANLVNNFGSGGVSDISLSGSGTVLDVTGGGFGCEAEALTVTSGAQILCVTAGSPSAAQVSPNGTLVAVSYGPNPGATTDIYTDGTLTTAVPGWALGWLDNTRLLAEQFGVDTGLPGNIPFYVSTLIFSSSGTNLGGASIPQLQTLQVLTSDSIYSQQTNTIISVTTGATYWASADPICQVSCPNVGAVSGSQAIFASGALVLGQPY